MVGPVDEVGTGAAGRDLLFQLRAAHRADPGARSLGDPTTCQPPDRPMGRVEHGSVLGSRSLRIAGR